MRVVDTTFCFIIVLMGRYECMSDALIFFSVESLHASVQTSLAAGEGSPSHRTCHESERHCDRTYTMLMLSYFII